MASDHYHRQFASSGDEGLAELYAIHFGKMNVNYQTSVAFRQFAIENRARPIEGHDSKSRGEHQSAQCAKH
jgi:hypothetical protein